MIFDEAHEIEDVAGQYFGFAVSTYRVQELRRDIAALSRMRKFGSEELDRILIRLEEIALHFFGLLPGGDGRSSFLSRDEFLDQHREIYTDLLAAFDLLAGHLKLIYDAPQEVIPLFRRANEMRAAIQFLIEGENPGFVHWIERRGRGVFLQATPIDVADLAAASLGQGGCGGADFGDAGGGGQVRLRGVAAGARGCAYADGAEPFRLQIAGSALYSEASAEPVESGVGEGGERGDRADSQRQPGAGVRAVHELHADAADVTTASRS